MKTVLLIHKVLTRLESFDASARTRRWLCHSAIPNTKKKMAAQGSCVVSGADARDIESAAMSVASMKTTIRWNARSRENEIESLMT